jgi:hypothetical protein
MVLASTLHLSFGDHAHNLNAGQKGPGTANSLKPQHGLHASLGRAMVLLDKLDKRRIALTNTHGHPEHTTGAASSGSTVDYIANAQQTD